MHLYRSHQTEALADALAEVLRHPIGDPFTPEIVVVQSRGMARWLSMYLAGRLGVCANVRFEFPAKLLGALTGGDDATDPYTPESLRWRILGALPDLLNTPAFAPLRADCAHLAESRTIDRRALSLSTRLADLFDRYVTWRPEVVRAWEETPGAAPPPDAADAWQPALWRALVAGMPDDARRHLAWRALSPAPARPWRRLSLFGMPSLPPLYLDVLAALSEGAYPLDIHLFVPVPIRLYAEGIAGPGQMLRARRRGGSHAEHLEEGHPLVTGMGRLALEFQQLLEVRGASVDEAELPEVLEPLGAPAASLLERLQRDIVELALPTPPESPPDLDAPGEDLSITVHACHSPMRQVEILRDELLSLLVAVPELAPRDIAVLTPDIETFAPLIEAVFGDPTARPRLPYQIADRATRTGNPWAEALLGALALASSRLPASAVLDLLALPPLQSRYGLEATALSAVGRLVADAGIRWGADETHRVAEGQPQDAQNTWRFGFDRMLLGLAMPEGVGEPFGDVMPLAGMEGAALDTLGRLVDAYETLSGHLDTFRTAAPLETWVDRLDALLTAWSGDASSDPALQRVREALLGLPEQASRAGLVMPLAPDALQDLLTGLLGAEDDGAAQAFLAGGVTFCALVPMRSIPFRVVCLLGMDEGAFPRNPARPAYDLMARDRRLGDRAPRDDDRYLFLEALLSARSHLRIFYTGFDIRTNASRPPSVAVEELMDVLRPMGAPPSLLRAHPLQPFSPRNFGRSAEGEAVPPESFDPRAFAGARALLAPTIEAVPFLDAPLEARPITEVTLAELVRFFEGPIAWFMRERLGVRFGGGEDTTLDREPFTLDALATHGVRDELLRGLAAAVAPEAARRAVRLSGVLPLGTPGDAVLAGELTSARAVYSAALALMGGPRLAPDTLRLTLDGVTVTGAVGDLYPGGRVVMRAGGLNARVAVRAWVTHVFWQTAVGFTATTTLVGRGKAGPDVWQFGEVPDARDRAAELLSLYVAGQVAPLRFFPASALAFVEALEKPEKTPVPPDEKRRLAFNAANTAWLGGFSGLAESANPENARLFGGVGLDAVDTILPGLVLPPEHTFEALARTIFGPALATRARLSAGAGDAE
jgi:exodeoxyribonuclease V gamma subunit